MLTPPDLKRLPVGARIQDLLLVLELDRRSYGANDCTVITFGNSTGRLDSAPFWSGDQARVAGISRGDVVEVVGEVGAFRGARQLKVSSIRRLTEAADQRSLLPSVGDTARYWGPLDRWRDEIRRPRLRAALALFYDDREFRRRYEECPASTVGHHAELGGLLKHTYEVAAIGRAMSEVCGADGELVLAGALLHDIGKIEAYRWDLGFEIAARGALLGHVTLGALMLDRRVAAADPPPCTERELAILHHLILSHHGKLEFGAAAPPMTLEAEILHYADDASAKAASMADALADPDNFAGESLLSSKGIWQIDRRKAYRGRSDWGLI